MIRIVTAIAIMLNVSLYTPPVVAQGIGSSIWRMFRDSFRKSPPPRRIPTRPTIPSSGTGGLIKSLQLPAALTQEAVSQATRVALSSTRRVPVSSSMSRTFFIQSEKLAPEAKKFLTPERAVTFVAGTILSNLVWVGVANALGIRDAPSPEIQADLEAEIAAAIESKERYFVKVCSRSDGTTYGVPSNSIRCLNGGEPYMIEEPIDFEKFSDELYVER